MSRMVSKSDSMDDLNDDMLEAEFARLQRKYRVMQNDIHAYRDESRKIITKQDSLINSLKSERVELETILMKIDANQNKKKDEYNVAVLSELSETEKKYTEQIEEENLTCQKLNVKIAEIEEKINQQRKKMGGTDNSRDKHIITKKQIRILENRHDKAVVHFSKQLARNRELRERIDHLRQERRVFDSLNKRLQHQLEIKKQKISDAIEQATVAYEQRDEAQSKMAAIRERSVKDAGCHEAEMKDLLRSIAHDKKLKNFMAVKANERIELKAIEATKKKKAADFATLIMAVCADMKRPNEEVNKMKLKGIIRSVGKNAMNAKTFGLSGCALDMEKVSISNYEKAFKHISSVTGEKNIDKIVENFIRKEEQNFALFNYVNELNNEIETLRHQLRKLKDNMEQFSEEDEQLKENRKGMMKKLEIQLNKTTREKDHADQRLREIAKVLHQLREGVGAMFDAIGCDGQSLEQMLGAKEGINDKTVMLYMGIIEQRTCELLRLWSFEKKKRAALEGLIPPQAPKPTLKPMDMALLSMLLPNTEDDSLWDITAEDEDIVPLSVEDVRKRVEVKLQKNHNKLLPPSSANNNQKKDNSKATKSAS